MITDSRAIYMAKPLMGDEEINSVTEVLKSGLLAQGEKVKEFETQFANYTGGSFGVATNSGTAALHTAIASIGIKHGDEILTTAFSFAATASCISMHNATPVFCDIDPYTFNILPEQIEQNISARTKAILLVHLYGQPCNMDRIMEIARAYNLHVIEDCAQAHGAEWHGKRVGSFGIGCFSFYSTKNMTTGEGGMIVTDDEAIAEKARMIRNHGQNRRYSHEILGYNYRMTDIAAAIGICQLTKLDEYTRKRIANSDTFTSRLNGINGLITPYTGPDVKHVFHQYSVRITNNFCMSRDALRKKLLSVGIETGIHYPIPLHKQRLFSHLHNANHLTNPGWLTINRLTESSVDSGIYSPATVGNKPLLSTTNYENHLIHSEKAAEEVLSLPIHPSLSKEDIDYIVESLMYCQDMG